MARESTWKARHHDLLFCGSFFITTLFFLCRATHGRDPDWLTPIASAYQKLVRDFHNVRAQGTIRKNYIKPDGTVRGMTEYAFEFRRLGDNLRTAQVNTKDANTRIFAGINAKYLFVARGATDGATVALVNVEVREPETLRLINAQKSMALDRICEDSMGALQWFGIPLESPIDVLRFNAPNLTATTTRENGRELLCLQGDFQQLSNIDGLHPNVVKYAIRQSNSKIFLDPAIDYRVVRWESSFEENGRATSCVRVCKYEKADNGIWTLSDVELKNGSPSLGFSTMNASLSDWQFDENEVADFYLSGIGLKEPHLGKLTFYRWLPTLLIGAALLIVGLWGYRRVRSGAA